MDTDTNNAADGSFGTVLVVDDEERNRRMLNDLLTAKDYTVVVAVDGEDALQKVQESQPHAILLDIMMPKMDGYEACRRLQAAPETKTIPVLMVTSLSEREDRLKGIDIGAHDFLTKPIDATEVVLRVRNAVAEKRLHDQVQEDYRKLQELETLRDNLMHMVVHDMRGPLSVMRGFLDILEIKRNADAKAMERYLTGIGEACDGLVEMVSSLLDVSRMENEEMPLNLEIIDLNNTVRLVAEKYDMSRRGAEVVFAPGDGVPLGKCDATIVERIVTNLTGNAVKFTPCDGTVTLRTEPAGEFIKVSVTDTGKGIPPEHHETIFEKFGQVGMRGENQKYSTGLGLTFCKLATEAHGGTIGVDSVVGEGSTFWFTIPVDQ